MKIIRVVFALAILMICGSFMSSEARKLADSTYDIKIEFRNIRNTKGRIQLQIYQDQTAFAAEKPLKQIHLLKSNMKSNALNYTVKDLKPGVYGFALLDDENKNGEMDYGLILPTEGFGFSDYYHTGWSKPKFTDFKFTVNSDKTVTMKIRYL